MKAIHVLADGSVKNDITGYRVSPDTSKEFYHVLSRIYGRGINEKKSEEKN